MNGYYQIYKRDKKTGRKSELIERYTSLTLNLNWGEVGRFTLKGETIDTVDVEIGDYVIICRNYVQIFSGVVTNLSISCSDTATNHKKWTATGKEDSVIFTYRVTVPDPTDMTFHDDYSDTFEGVGYARILHYIRRNLGNESNIVKVKDMGEEQDPIITELVHREIDGLVLPGERTLGNDDISSYRYKALNTALSEIGKEVNPETKEEWGLYPIYVWDSETGEKRIEITQLRDRTKQVLISPVYGNVTSWSKTSSYPKYNALWVVSGSWEEPDQNQKVTKVNEDGEEEEEELIATTRIYVYFEDKESIAKFGRIEKVETKSDIKVVKPEEDESEEEADGGEGVTEEKPKTITKYKRTVIHGDNDEWTLVEETNEEGEKESKVVTEEQVRRLLSNEARKLLKENASTVKYKISMVETPELQYWDHWKCGDLVSCDIEGEKFQAIIKSVEITYENGQEKVKPTVGEVEQGEFANIFKWLSDMETRIEVEELD